MTFLIIGAAIDLSVRSKIDLSSVVAPTAARRGSWSALLDQLAECPAWRRSQIGSSSILPNSRYIIVFETTLGSALGTTHTHGMPNSSVSGCSDD
jgi:ribose/xylose/arabinose/galactoside ABC-type transport system permease subunit